MNKDLILAKIRLQQAEIRDIMEILKDKKELSKSLKEAFEERLVASSHLIETFQDESIIPHGQEIDVKGHLDKMEKDVSKAKEGVKKIQKLEERKEKIKKELLEE